ncbi:MAG: hypothetical protein JXR77_19050 [Lentisphaeria bacterium]|nr:hypothetical protein [Lentisphaeria bacterium]
MRSGTDTMEGILAIDAGGSKCDALLADLAGNVLGNGTCCRPGLSGRDERCLVEAGRAALRVTCFDRLVTAGPGRPLPAALRDAFQAATIEIVPCDEVTPALSHAGVTHGVVLLAGTGAFAHARTRDGRTRHLDGTGPILGDFGGGYHIGTMALHAIVRSGWHPRHATSLRDRVLQRFGVSSPAALFGLGLFARDRSVVASIAQTVREEADRGDAIAIRILEYAAEAMAETFRDLTDVLGIAADTYTVVGTGGIIRRSEAYWTHLRDRIAAIAPDFTCCRLPQPPVVSCAIHALKQVLGSAASEAVARLVAQVEALHLDAPDPASGTKQGSGERARAAASGASGRAASGGARRRQASAEGDTADMEDSTHG